MEYKGPEPPKDPNKKEEEERGKAVLKEASRKEGLAEHAPGYKPGEKDEDAARRLEDEKYGKSDSNK